MKSEIISDFDHLITSISQVHDTLRRASVGSVNRMLTYRNWLIGRYIVEYEQSGSDRAEYGANLIPRLAQILSNKRGFSERNLRMFREFYREYPLVSQVISKELSSLKIEPFPMQHWKVEQENDSSIRQKASAEFSNLQVNQSVSQLSPSPDVLVKHFSFSHFVELMHIIDPLKRAFYEIEGIKGCWSVPQLKRQIESLLFERTGMSKNKSGVVESAHLQNKPDSIDDMIRDPYILEFTGLPERSYYSEADLETALLDHIQAFLLELGNGFCFEARQKRITIDNEHDRIDLVFYHRILRCHLLIDLKVRKFRPGDAGQMNFYLNYYRENMMAEGDNPPVGLVLCTDRDETRVQYAVTGMDNRFFVSKYQTVLPTEEQIRTFLESDRDRTENVLKEQRALYEGR
jgi:predicted nuclease of restriction endonuclease-like (RecB) superfamily